MGAQLELSELKLKVKELELTGNTATAPQASATDPQKEELYTALMKSNLELQTEKLTKTFEEKERRMISEITQLKEKVRTKSAEVFELIDKMATKEKEMKQ